MDISEQYRVERINRDIEYQEKQRKLALIKAYASIEYCKTLSDRGKEKAKNILYTLQSTKTKKKYNVRKQLQNRLKKELTEHHYISSSSVCDTIEKLEQKYRMELEWQARHKIANEIAKSPAQATLDATSDYIHCCNRIEQLKEELANPPKKVEKKPEPKKETQTRTTPTYTAGTTYTPEEYRTPTRTTSTAAKPVSAETPREIIPQPYTYSDSETVKYQKTLEYLTTKYQKESESKYFISKVYFDDQDKKMLERLFGGDKYQNYAAINQIEELIENGYTVEATLNHFKRYNRLRLVPFQNPKEPKLEDLLDMALIIYKELPEELLTTRSAASEKAIFVERLTQQVGVMHYLEKYEEAYNLFMKYYNKLNDEEKQKAKENFERKNTVRFEKLGIKEFEILRPEELKRLVNYQVMEKMEKNHNMYGYDNDLEIHMKLKKATTFMDTGLIYTTYLGIKREHDKWVSYSTLTEDEIKARREWFKNLQRNFAHLLLKRLTAEEKKDKTVDQQLYYVCKEFLKEEPLFPLDLKKTLAEEQAAVDQLYGNKKAVQQATGAVVADDATNTVEYGTPQTEVDIESNTATQAGYNAMNRFFGMSKAEQTIQRITGKWAKFERAWSRAQQAKSQQEIEEVTEELNGMFRR